MDEIDKNNNNSANEDSDNTSQKIIKIDEIESRGRSDLYQLDFEPAKIVEEAVQKFANINFNFKSYATEVNVSTKKLYDAINSFNALHSSMLAENIDKSLKISEDLSNVVLAAQHNAINQVIDSINNIDFSELAERISRTMLSFNENISASIIESVANNLKNISEIDFSNITLDYKDITQTINLIDDVEFEIEFNKNLAKNKDLSKASIYIKKVILLIYFVISLASDTITVWNFVDERIYPINQKFFNKEEEVLLYNESENSSWLSDEMEVEISKQFKSSFRVVDKDELIVREEKRKDSKILGSLNAGYIVQIVEKRKNWTYIIYTNPKKNEIVQGWTNTKHLKKIK